MKEIYLGRAGSHSYGTNTPTSDEDYRGIFVADQKFIRTPFYKQNEYRHPNQKDSVSYELNKFMSLYTECNPNIVELLWVDEGDIIIDSPAYQLLRKHRHDLLSSRVAFTFSGYAVSQLKQMKNQSKWQNNPQPKEPPRQTDYVSLVVNYTNEKMFKVNIEDYKDNHRLVHYGSNIYGLYKESGYTTFNNYHLNVNSEEFDHTTMIGERKLPIMVVKFNVTEYKQSLQVWKQYWDWRTLKDKKVELYSLIESELAERTTNTREVVDVDYDVDRVIGDENMSELVKTMKASNLTDLLHLCKRHFDFAASEMDCYSDDTQFLTENGWKYYHEIEDDLLCTFNTKTFKLEKQPYIERFCNLYTGNMYKFNGLYSDTMVTANHRMFINKQERKSGKKYEWEFIEACKSHDYFEVLHRLTPRANRSNIPENIDKEIFNHIDMHNYLRVIGWYCSEGSSVINDNGMVTAIRISQSKPDSRLTQNMEKLRNMGKINCKHHIYDRGQNRYPENTYTFNGYIAQHIVAICGRLSKNVHLPNFVFDLTGREQNILLTALLQGDGTKRPDGSYVYYTTSPQLADDVQRLCVCAGHAAHLLGPYQYEKSNQNEPCYQIHIWKHPEKTKRLQRNINVTTEYVENKKVVCFEVSNGTLITRRNGKVSYHGNCKHGMHLVRLLRMGREILEHGEVFVKRPDAKELLEIRNGSWSYEQLVAYGEEQDMLIRTELYEKTKLPKRPNIELASDLILQVQDMVWV